MSKIADLIGVGFDARQSRAIAAQVGWCDIDEAWAYASATTITVPTGAASRFQVGDKIRVTQTTVKYFYVVAVADTVLTVTGGSDYTVANAAISAIAYSRAERPFSFPDWFAYTATPEGFSSNPTGSVSRFCMKGKLVTVTHSGGNNGTSNDANFKLLAPVACGASASSLALCHGVDNSAGTPGSMVQITRIDPTKLYLYKAPNSGAWTASGGKNASFTISYEAA